MLDLKTKFSLGQIAITQGANDILNDLEINTLLLRHGFGDWGDACEETKQANDEAINDGSRIFSVYKVAQGSTVWIITESEATTILLPCEY